MKTTSLSAFVLLVCAVACNDNQEEITIRPDGSAAVNLSVEGPPVDVAEGYAIPLRAPWSADDAATLEWLRVVGPDAGGTSVRANAERLDKSSKVFVKDNTVRLAVHAEFRSVADLPLLYAPEAEPYRTAFLQRRTGLKLEKKGSRTVYTFERRYGARDWRRFNLGALLQRHMSGDLWKRVEAGAVLTDDERAQVARAGEAALWGSMMSFANAGLEAIFVHGDASLPVASVDRIRKHVEEALVQCAPPARIERIVARIFPADGSNRPVTDAEGAALERELREVLRTTLPRELAAEDVTLSMRNAVMGELEWHLAAYDASADLNDDTFTFTVTMPGTIVGGNAEVLHGSTATWKFNGKELHEREMVLRAVSVLE